MEGRTMSIVRCTLTMNACLYKMAMLAQLLGLPMISSLLKGYYHPILFPSSKRAFQIKLWRVQRNYHDILNIGTV